MVSKLFKIRKKIKDSYDNEFSQELTNQYSMRWTYINKNYPSNYDPNLVL